MPQEIGPDEKAQGAFDNMVQNKEELTRLRRQQSVLMKNFVNEQQTEAQPVTNINEDNKKLLIHWANHSREKQELHELARSHFNFWGNAIFISSMILSASTGISSLITSGDSNKSQASGIAFGMMGLMSSVLMSVYKQLQFPESVSSHKLYSTEYCKIKDDIMVHLTIHMSSQKMYSSMEEFIKFCHRQIVSLGDRAPPLNGTVKKKFEKSKQKSGAPDKNNFSTLSILNSHQV